MTTYFKVVKRILRYVKGAIDFGFLYLFPKDYKLIGYSDSNWSGDVDGRKSTIIFVFFIGDFVFTWMSNKQLIFTLSNFEAENTAVNSSVCDVVWLRNLLKESGLSQEEPRKNFIDKKSAIALTKNLVVHDRSKYIDTRYHFLQEYIERKDIQTKYVKSHYQIADILTKPLKKKTSPDWELY